MNVVAVLVGAAWLAVSALKIHEPTPFLEYVGSTLHVSPAVGWTIIASELVLGSSVFLLAVLRRAPRLMCGLLLSSLGAAVALAAFSWFSDPAGGSCGCFGAELELTRLQRVAVAGALLFASSLALRQQLGLTEAGVLA